MTDIEFDDIVTKTLVRVVALVSRKQKAVEYATDDDRLHNFNAAGKLLVVTPAEAAVGFAAKHWVSIRDLLDKAASEVIDATLREGYDVHLKSREERRKVIDEKCDDAIAYFLLIKACLIQELDRE
jgi:hypothetical protein